MVLSQHKDYPGLYTFDQCFGADSRQEDVFNYSAMPIVDGNLRQGTTKEEVTLTMVSGLFRRHARLQRDNFCLRTDRIGKGGQKEPSTIDLPLILTKFPCFSPHLQTHTMMGPDIEDPELKGVIPRLVEAIFDKIEASPETLEFALKVSYLEIYMEKVRDLLNPANDNLPVHEEKGKGVYVKGATEIYVSSLGEVFDIMKRGLVNRATAYTNMNEASSRSHSIFVITVQCKDTRDGSNKIGRLYLVDLAGSEKIKKTDASGQTLEEAKKINKSLSSLGMVINALTDGKVCWAEAKPTSDRSK